MKKLNIYIKETLKYFFRSKLFIGKHVSEVEMLYNLDIEALEDYKNNLFLKNFRLAINYSPFYKKLYAEAGITEDMIKSVKDIDKLPIIDKTMIRHCSTDLIPSNSKKRLTPASTSGSTGTPLTVYRDYYSILRDYSYYYVFRKRRGFKYGQRLVSIKGNLDRSIKTMNLHLSNTLYLSSYNINEDIVLNTYYKKIKDFKPVAIEGYPSSIYNICSILKEHNLQLNIPVVFTTSETLFDYQRDIIEEVMNTQIYDYYGNCERSVSLLECMDHRGYYESPGFAILEFVNDTPITTSLINLSYPLIRYKVDDVVTLSEDRRFKDGEYNTVESIEGRLDDVIITKNGSRIGRLGFLFMNLKGVKQAQIVQTEIGKIDVNIVPDGAFRLEDQEYLSNLIDERIGLNNIDLKINLILESDIIYTKMNKFRVIVSKLNE